MSEQSHSIMDGRGMDAEHTATVGAQRLRRAPRPDTVRRLLAKMRVPKTRPLIGGR
jgi:hypothetical protein